MSKTEPVFIAITIDSFIFPEKCKVRYETRLNVDDPTLTKINSLMECIKCGINAFEDEIAEMEEESKDNFNFNIVKKGEKNERL